MKRTISLLEPAAVPALTRKRLPILLPFLGRTVLEHAITGLVQQGATRITVRTDHTPSVQPVVQEGRPWGIPVKVVGDTAHEDEEPGLPFALDHLPQAPDYPLWQSYRAWQAAQIALMPVIARTRIGVRELSPGIFVGLRSRVHASAKLVAPCWVGENVFVGPQTTLGPGSIIEDGVYVDEGAQIVSSLLGPETYLGPFTELCNSFAWGTDLLHLDKGTVAVVDDRLLLGEVRVRKHLLEGIFHRIQNRHFSFAKPGRTVPAGSVRLRLATRN